MLNVHGNPAAPIRLLNTPGTDNLRIGYQWLTVLFPEEKFRRIGRQLCFPAGKKTFFHIGDKNGGCCRHFPARVEDRALEADFFGNFPENKGI